MEKIVDNNTPLSVSFEITWRCNLSCLHCYQFQSSNQELTTPEIKDILDQLADAGAFYLSFTGGEPLMREDFWEIAEYARYKTFSIMLQTNGSLITHKDAKNIHRLNFSEVRISLLGATESIHDGITRVEGSFKRVIEAIRLLKEESVRVIFATTLMRENAFEYRQFRDLADRLGVILITSPVVYPKNNGDNGPIGHRLTEAEIKQVYSYYFEWDPEMQKQFCIERKGLLCGFGRIACSINPKGELYPCVALPLAAGSLRMTPFKDIWSKSEILNRIRAIQEQDLGDCYGCSLSLSCFRCSAMSYFEKGEITAVPEECCRITKTLKEVRDAKEA
ncbi:MAG: radical SAM protein [Candidatus Omnitrophota bacterium]